jgi:hypothetical protein
MDWLALGMQCWDAKRYSWVGRGPASDQVLLFFSLAGKEQGALPLHAKRLQQSLYGGLKSSQKKQKTKRREKKRR